MFYDNFLINCCAGIFKDDIEAGNFVFADFDVDGEYSVSDAIRFKGATAFEDENETMFISDELLKGLDEELDAFLKELLEK